MVVCSNCHQEVNEGKFCENCGSPLNVNKTVQSANNTSSKNLGVCPICNATNQYGKFCEKCGSPLSNQPAANNIKQNQFQKKNTGLFDKISSSVNRAATDMFAIKSDYTGGIIICKSSKIPNVQEKKIVVNENELLYFNSGFGFVKYMSTFTTNDINFETFYIKKETYIDVQFPIMLNVLLKNIDEDHSLNINFNYGVNFKLEEYDKFFNYFIAIKNDAWSEIQISEFLSNRLQQLIIDKISFLIKEDGNYDLVKKELQINSFINIIKELVNENVLETGLTVNNINNSAINFDVNELNKLLIDYIYTKTNE